MHASAARSGSVLAARRFIAHADLGKELDAIGGQVGPHSGAPHCRGGAGDGHQNRWTRLVLLREHVPLLGPPHRWAPLLRSAGGPAPADPADPHGVGRDPPALPLTPPPP